MLFPNQIADLEVQITQIHGWKKQRSELVGIQNEYCEELDNQSWKQGGKLL